MSEVEFKAWPKIPRHKNNTIIVSEKIDGTNGCIIVQDGEVVGVQSRNRLIDVHNDNMGFANWVEPNKELLATTLGDGYHYGEWAGPGIQKNPHNLTEKTFFLFNTSRQDQASVNEVANLTVVGVLYHGEYTPEVLESTMLNLKQTAEEKGYTPEGIIIYWTSSRTLEKMTFANSEGKWKSG